MLRRPVSALLRSFQSIATAAAVASLTLATPVEAQIVRGQVVDSLSQAPLAGATVTLLALDSTPVGQTTTDPEGLFLIRADDPGRYWIQVTLESYALSGFPPFAIGAGEMQAYMLLVAPQDRGAVEAAEALDAVLTAVCPNGVPEGLPVIIGQVTDAATGTPVPGATVHLTWTTVPEYLLGQVDMDHASGTAVSGSSGFYGICGAPTQSRLFLHATTDAAMSAIVAMTFDSGGVFVGEAFDQGGGRLHRQDLALYGYPARQSVVMGQVVDSVGNPVGEARVQVVGTDISDRTTFLGMFELTRLAGGDARLSVERVGYRPVRVDVAVGVGDTLDLGGGAITLAQIPTRLPDITVAAEASDRRRELRDFERRRESAPSGTYTTRQEWENTGNARTTIDVLRRMRGIVVRPGYGPVEWLVTTRRGMSRTGIGAGVCFPHVYMDNQYVGTTANLDVERLVPLVNLEAIEAHASTAGMPPELNRGGSVCGALVFWTR